jgi:amidohydrolase
MRLDGEQLKQAARKEVDQVARLLIETSDWMYANPEIGLQEHRASARLTDILSEFGATVERGIAGMPTAFVATLPGASPGPKIAIIAEYDALPEVGHGCGHNIIATAALGASLALARLGGQVPGQIVVVGTPAEESTVPDAGGKIPILNHGYFDGVDAAIMMHPWTQDGISYESSLVAHGLDISFHGRSAHAAANPHEGINALDALIVMFSSVGLLRQQIRSDARIHGIILHGGTAPNVIPAFTSCRFRVRSKDPSYTRELVERVVACAAAGAQAAGARMEWREYMPPYLNMVPNETVGELMKRNLAALGREVIERRGSDSSGSTDLGNVSHRVPASCIYLRICGPEASWHSTAVADSTITPAGHAAILDGAKTLAMTAIDMLLDARLVTAAHREHRIAMEEVEV